MNRNVLVSDTALEFFNDLAATLEIELSPPAQPEGGLRNLIADPRAEISSLRLEAEVYESNIERRRPLTPAELDTVVLAGSELEMRGEAGDLMRHEAPNGRNFTVRDLLHAVEHTERLTRSSTEWLGGIDVHHIYFEGIERAEDGTWDICWGS